MRPRKISFRVNRHGTDASISTYKDAHYIHGLSEETAQLISSHHISSYLALSRVHLRLPCTMATPALASAPAPATMFVSVSSLTSDTASDTAPDPNHNLMLDSVEDPASAPAPAPILPSWFLKHVHTPKRPSRDLRRYLAWLLREAKVPAFPWGPEVTRIYGSEADLRVSP